MFYDNIEMMSAAEEVSKGQSLSFGGDILHLGLLM